MYPMLLKASLNLDVTNNPTALMAVIVAAVGIFAVSKVVSVAAKGVIVIAMFFLIMFLLGR